MLNEQEFEWSSSCLSSDLDTNCIEAIVYVRCILSSETWRLISTQLNLMHLERFLLFFLEKVTEIYLKVPKYGRTGILETFYHILARVGLGLYALLVDM